MEVYRGNVQTRSRLLLSCVAVFVRKKIDIDKDRMIRIEIDRTRERNGFRKVQISIWQKEENLLYLKGSTEVEKARRSEFLRKSYVRKE